MSKRHTDPFIAAVAVLLFSRIAYYYAGIHFDSTPLIWFWQLLDPYLLRNHLISSLSHLHTQPPLFNALIGLTLKASGRWFSEVMHIFYLFFGIGLLWSLYTVMSQLGVHRKLAAVLATLFLISPSSILYENWLFYTYPMAFLLTFALVVLYRSIEKESDSSTFLFFLSLSFCVLIRTSFHLIWFLAILLLLLKCQPNRAGRVLQSVAIPLFLVCLVYGESLYIFGQYPGTTWLGMSLFKVASAGISGEERRELVRKEKISPYALSGAYSWLSNYPIGLRRGRQTGIPALDQKIKTTGFNNYNHFAYQTISRHNLQDSIGIIFYAPRSYFRSVLESFRIYTFSAAQLVFLKQNRQKIAALDLLLNRFALGDFSGGPEGPYWFMILGLPPLFVYGIIKTRRFFRKKKIAAGITLLFLLLNIFYASIVGNFFEIGENNRYRYEIDTYFIVLFALSITDFITFCSKVKKVNGPPA